jgi:acetylornithine deacetylase/succinyl-diaminopimelate desuccinylase family protein
MSEASVLETLAELVRINSINPAYENGNPEAEIVAYIERFFGERGIETWQQEVLPGRPNLIARLPGQRAGRRIILEAHADTASVTGMTIPPFEPVIRDGRMYGRGSCDTKAGLAAMMHAVASLHSTGHKPECEVWMVAAADEEYSFRGVSKLCEHLKADAAIVAEPTELRPVIASKGVLRWKVCTTGKAAHSSKPHLGVNAIVQMARVIQAFEKGAAALEGNVHPLLGPATLNIGVIRGGVQVNFVPDHCEIEVDRRLLPGEKATEVLAGYQTMLNRLHEDDRAMRVCMEPPMLLDEALETPSDAMVARTAAEVLRNMGLPGELVGVPYGSDASKLSRHGVPSIIFGPGSIDLAHAAVEYVECDHVIQAEEFYRGFLKRFN